MDWKIIIFIYYYFQTLQSQHLNRADKTQIITISDLTNDLPGCTNGGALLLCFSCNYKSEPVEIYPAQSLFVNLTVSEGSNQFKVIVETQKDKSATLTRDIVSKTVSSARSKVFFSVDVTEGHRYVIIRVEGSNCSLILIEAEVYYYYVPEQTRLLTVFPDSSAPSTSKEILVVYAECTPNAGYLQKPTMEIYPNGTFKLQGSCGCNPGYELNGTNCSGGSFS